MMQRRSFLRGLLFVAATPAIVRIDSLMRLPAPRILRPDGYSEALILDLLDLRGNVVQSLPARRAKGIIEVLPAQWYGSIWSYRLRQGEGTKFHYHLGPDNVGPNGVLHFFDPDDLRELPQAVRANLVVRSKA